MKVLGFIKDGEHIITCNCGAVIKFSNEDVVSEDIIDVDYWGVDRWTEHSIVCKKCKRKILINRT